MLRTCSSKQLIQVLDAAVVSWEVGKKKPRTRELRDTRRAGALGGGFWGLLFGLIFFIPILGLAIGAATGALIGSMADVGISDSFIRDVREKVTPGTSALFLLSSDAVMDRVTDRLQGQRRRADQHQPDQRAGGEAARGLQRGIRQGPEPGRVARSGRSRAVDATHPAGTVAVGLKLHVRPSGWGPEGLDLTCWPRRGIDDEHDQPSRRLGSTPGRAGRQLGATPAARSARTEARRSARDGALLERARERQGRRAAVERAAGRAAADDEPDRAGHGWAPGHAGLRAVRRRQDVACARWASGAGRQRRLAQPRLRRPHGRASCGRTSGSRWRARQRVPVTSRANCPIRTTTRSRCRLASWPSGFRAGHARRRRYLRTRREPASQAGARPADQARAADAAAGLVRPASRPGSR